MHPAILQFVQFKREHAEAVLSWKYPPPYELYSSLQPTSEESVAQLLAPELNYRAVLDENRGLIAFRCYGVDARVAGGAYEDEALDLGGGLRPDLTGQGLGKHVIAAAMAYAWDRFHPRLFRVTIATFNTRALKTYERLGYQKASCFIRPADGREFTILTKVAAVPELQIPMRVS
ncbi:MAG TPA: GNAT family protein [Opitutaceae bacterium]|nr:GNAT family protein [Opitutaceae bacterium]